MKKFTLILLAGFILFPSAALMACLNGFDDLMEYEIKKSRAKFPIPLGHPLNMQDGEVKSAFQYNEQGFKRGKYQSSIDYALFLIYDKKYEEAEKVLADLAGKYGNKYQVAANYGTILEVNGKNEEALKWIKKAIEIDPNSHDGSEWIHVAILEAKIRGDKPVAGSKMTGYDFGLDTLPKTTLTEKQLKKLQQELFFQLNERLTFIPPKDPYIAALMFELGNVTLALDQKKSAKAIYQKAKAYGFTGQLLDKRMAATSPNITVPAPPDTVMAPQPEPQPVVDTLPKDTAQVVPPTETEESHGNGGGMVWLLVGIGAVVTAGAGWLMTRVMRSRK